MNWTAILAAAKRAQAAYIEDDAKSKAAFEALGLTWLGQYQDRSHQAVLSRDAAGFYLSISGTRFSTGKLGDLFDDIDLDPVDVGGGAQVTKGAYDGLANVWHWATSVAPAGTVLNVEGHSLGAWRTRYTPLFLPREQIGALHSFESPKSANAAYYARYAAELANLVCVVNALDLWVSWPFLGDWTHPPHDVIWLQETGYQTIAPSQWPGGRRLSDHDIDLVVSRLEKIVAAESAVA